MDSNTTSPEVYGQVALLYPSAIIFPAFAFPSWLLCMAPMIWHFRQANIAAGSLILWIILANFFNSVNALIWPRDNMQEWWDGSIWCDIHVRIQVGSYVGMTASVALVVRKLAIVMDTRNMTVSTSKKSRMWAKIWEVVWCWVMPGLFIALYYVVQPARYFIYGIVGCISAHDSSWPSIVLGFMWPAIGMLFASYWASLLIYRLYRYRREFHRLVAARNTTSSRFVRLFILSLVIVLAYLSYSIYLLVDVSQWITDPYSWSSVHDPSRFNNIIKIPVHGVVSFEKWVQVATGYTIFCLLGTGVDANAHYRRILVRMGAGKIWPDLYVEQGNGSRAASKSLITAKAWTANMSSRAKSMLWSTGTDSTKMDSTLTSSTLTGSTRDTCTHSTSNKSVVLDSVPQLHSVATQDTLLSQKHDTSLISASPSSSPTAPPPSFFRRWFAQPCLHGPLLPLFSHRNIVEIAADTNRASTSSTPTGVHARAWAEDTFSSPSSIGGKVGEGHECRDGVHVLREVHQQRDRRAESECELEGKEMMAWA